MTRRTAIVTGAVKGIGLAITRRLEEENYYIHAVDVDDENGKRLSSTGINYIHADICSEADVERIFSLTGQVDVVVNNAGIIRDNMIWKMPSSDFDKVVDINLKGTWLMCRKAAILFKEQKSGRIINIASRAWLGNRGQTNYSASKAGIIGLTRSLALELGKYNVLVNAVAPGLIDTSLTQKLRTDVMKQLLDAQPTKTIGQPEDVANAVAFLAAPGTRFITGQTIYVDGGKSIGAGI